MNSSLQSPSWGTNEKILLSNIHRSKNPDVQSFCKLNRNLETGDEMYMQSFLGAGGVLILVQAINNRIIRQPLTEVDIVILYEVFLSCQLIMETPNGIEEFLSLNNGIESIARCLNFESKLYALKVLELLCSICCHSPEAAQAVFRGLKLSAKSRKEAPFADLTFALIELDVEVKTSVMRLVNSLLNALSTTHVYIELKSDMNSQLFDERIIEASQLVERGLEELNISSKVRSGDGDENSNVRRKSILAGISMSLYDNVDFGDIYDNTTGSNSYDDVHKSSSTTTESLSFGDVYSKVTGDDNVTFTDLYDKDGDFDSNSYGENCDSSLIDDVKFGDVYDGAQTSASEAFDNIVPNVEFFTSSQQMMKSPRSARSQKSPTETKPVHDPPVNKNGLVFQDENNVSYAFVPSSDTLKVTSKFKTVSVTPINGTMAGSLLMTKASKHLYMITSKPVTRWFELDNENLKHTISVDSLLEGCMSISSMTDIRSYCSNSTIMQETEYSFEIETSTHVYAFGCIDATIKDSWLTALNFNREKFIVDNSSFKAKEIEMGDLTVEKVLHFADEFKQECSMYSTFLEDHRYEIDDLAINVDNIDEVCTFLLEEMAVAGLSSKLLIILHEFLRIPTGTEFVWDIIYASIKAIRMNCNKSVNGEGHSYLNNSDRDESEQLCMEDCPTALKAMLGGKKDHYGGDYSEIGNLAMISIQLERDKNRLEQENKDLCRRLCQFEEDFKSTNFKSKPVSNELSSDEQKILRMMKTIKDYDELFLSDQKKTQRLHDKIRDLEEELDFLKRREINGSIHASTISPLSAFKSPKDNASNSLTPSNDLEPIPAFSLPPGNILVPSSGPSTPLSPTASTLSALLSSKLRALPPIASPISVPAVEVTTAVNPTVEVTIASAIVPDKYEKYRKMLKLLSEGAVKQKMTMDGFSTIEIDQFFTGKTTNEPIKATPSRVGALLPAPTTSVGIPLPPQADEKLEKYQKMMKILPEHAVRQKMAMDGFTVEQIDNFIRNKGESTSNGDVGIASQKYDKYIKMLKMLPETAVRQKMVMDGLPAAEVDQFFIAKNNDSAGGSSGVSAKTTALLSAGGDGSQKEAVEDPFAPPEGMEPKVLVNKPAVKLKGLFWSKLKPTEVKTTVFHRLSDFSIDPPYLQEIDALFAANTAKAAKKGDSDASKSSSSAADNALLAEEKTRTVKLISVVDSNRVQNILIVMGKLRLGPEEIMRLVVELDPDVMTPDITNSIISILPLSEEVNALRCHTDPSKLDQASKLYFHLCRIPRLVSRVECHEIAFSWHSFSHVVYSQLHIIQSAVDELNRFQSHMEVVLAMILAIGNYLNADTKWGLAYGFKLETISKLESMKASQGSGGSMMNILSKLVVDKAPEVLSISEKWIAISAAASISFRQIISDVELLETQVKKLTQEYARIQDGEVNMGLDGVLERRGGYVTHPLNKRLESFLQVAKPSMDNIRLQVADIERSVGGVMELYGETFSLSSDEDLCKKFFLTVSSFFRSLRTAAEENLKKKRAAEKLQRLDQERKNRTSLLRQNSSGGNTKSGRAELTPVLTSPGSSDGTVSAPVSPLKFKRPKIHRLALQKLLQHQPQPEKIPPAG